MDPVFRVSMPDKGHRILRVLSDWYTEWAEYFNSFAGNDVELIIRKARRPNTRPEQNYYRGVVVQMIADEIGETPQRAHEILQAEFFTYIDDCGFRFVRSTAIGEWTTAEWEEKMQEIRMWASDFLGVSIPLPNEVDLKKNMEALYD